MALPAVELRADPIADLARTVSAAAKTEFYIKKPGAGREIFLLHHSDTGFDIRIYTSYDIVGRRPHQDPYIHFLLLGQQKRVSDIWHAKRILFSEDEKNLFAVSGRRAEALALLMNYYAGCPKHRDHQARPYYVDATGMIAWCCSAPECYWFQYAPYWVSEIVVAETDKHFRSERSIFDPALKAAWREEPEPLPKQIQLSFQFEAE